MEGHHVIRPRVGGEGGRLYCADFPFFLRRQSELPEVRHLVEAGIVDTLTRAERHVFENTGIVQLVMSSWLLLLRSVSRLCPNLGIEGQNHSIKVWHNEHILMWSRLI